MDHDPTADEYLADMQARNEDRPARQLGVRRRPRAVTHLVASGADGVEVECGLVENPGNVLMIATFTQLTSPDVDPVVVEHEVRRARARAHREFTLRRSDERRRATHLRRPSCNTRRRGTGRPARRSTRRTTRTSARSGSSGPSGSDAPGDAGPPHAHLTLTSSPTPERGSGA